MGVGRRASEGVGVKNRPDRYGGKAHYEPWTQQPQAALTGLPTLGVPDAENPALSASDEPATGVGVNRES